VQGIVFRGIHSVIAIFAVLAAALSSAGAQTMPALRLQTVAPGVHVLRAPGFEPTPDNAGFVTNIGVIEDERGLVLLGTGTSHRFANHLIDFVEHALGRPVIAAVDLYGGGDHVLGNGVFVSRGVPVTAQVETDRFIRASCHTCVERLTAALGENMMSGTVPVAATVVFERPGYLTGVSRRIRLLHFGHTFQPGATAVFDEATGTLFAGELGSAGWLPDLYNANETGWRDALTELAALGARQVVPAHGAPGGREVLDEPRRYLDALIGRVGEVFAAGTGLLDALDQVEVAGFGNWHGYAIWHRRNVHFAYLHREEQEFGQTEGHRAAH
jgi:glyoxylase-like metal-dependent hydrolase (beta-lactamase superfamily II)